MKCFIKVQFLTIEVLTEQHPLLFLLSSKNSVLFLSLDDPEAETLSQAWSYKYVLIISVESYCSQQPEVLN